MPGVQQAKSFVCVPCNKIFKCSSGLSAHIERTHVAEAATASPARTESCRCYVCSEWQRWSALHGVVLHDLSAHDSAAAKAVMVAWRSAMSADRLVVWATAKARRRQQRLQLAVNRFRRVHRP